MHIKTCASFQLYAHKNKVLMRGKSHRRCMDKHLLVYLLKKKHNANACAVLMHFTLGCSSPLRCVARIAVLMDVSKKHAIDGSIDNIFSSASTFKPWSRSRLLEMALLKRMRVKSKSAKSATRLRGTHYIAGAFAFAGEQKGARE